MDWGEGGEHILTFISPHIDDDASRLRYVCMHDLIKNIHLTLLFSQLELQNMLQTR